MATMRVMARITSVADGNNALNSGRTSFFILLSGWAYGLPRLFSVESSCAKYTADTVLSPKASGC